MRKKISLIIFVLCTLLIASMVSAEDVPISAVISGSSTALAGGQIELTVTITSVSTEFLGGSVYLSYPADKLAFKSVEKLSVPTAANANWTAEKYTDNAETGKLQIGFYDDEFVVPVAVGNSASFKLTFGVKPTASGSAKVSIDEINFLDSDYKDFKLYNAGDFEFTVITCDLNKDDATDVLDAIVLRNYIAGGSEYSLYYDFNEDNAVDAADVLYLYQIILGHD